MEIKYLDTFGEVTFHVMPQHELTRTFHTGHMTVNFETQRLFLLHNLRIDHLEIKHV